MIRNQLERLVRSIAYRRRLEKDLLRLEGELISFMKLENFNQVVAGGYKVQLNGGDLTIERKKNSNSDLNQLELDFKEQFSREERSDSNERQITRS